MPGLIAIQVTDRGNTPRRLQKTMRQVMKAAWETTGQHWHAEYRELRFDPNYARRAGFTRRKGEGLPRGSAAFRRSYTGRKVRIYGHENPLEYSGDTRRRIRSTTLSATSKGVKLRYSANKFNFKHPKSRVRMSEEFRTITPQDERQLAEFFDRQVDIGLRLVDQS